MACQPRSMFSLFVYLLLYRAADQMVWLPFFSHDGKDQCN